MSNPTLILRPPSDQRGAERRQSTDRRRGADLRTAVFEICRSNLHLAVVVGSAGGAPSKVITRSLRWRQEASALHSEVGIKELTAAIRTLVAEERLSGATAHIALSGEFCVTRVVTGTIDAVRRECSDLEERSHRYLTLGPGRKVHARSIDELDARHQHALLTVTNQRTLETLLAIGESVGLHVKTIEPSLVALSRTQSRVHNGCRDACLVIQLDDGGAEVGICHRGRLLLDYRPGGRTDASNVADVLAQHLTRVQRYLNRNHPDLNSPVRQVYLTGEASAIAEAERQFKQYRQFQVALLDPSQLDTRWQFASSTPGPEVAAVLGTAMLEDAAGEYCSSPNLMDEKLAELQKPMRQILTRSLLPVAAVLLVATGLLAMFARERMETNSQRAKLAELESVRTRARELQLMLTAADAKLIQLQTLQNRLPRPRWSNLLTHIAQSMPDDVWLDRLEISDAHSAELAGSSYADGGVYDFVGYLKRVPEIEEIALQTTGVGQSPSGPTATFSLQLSLVPAFDPKGPGE